MSDTPTRKTAGKAKTQRSFGETTRRLDEIISLMDDPRTELESMIVMVEEGLNLIRESRSILADAELRIQKLEAIPAKAERAKPERAKPVPEAIDSNDFSLI